MPTGIVATADGERTYKDFEMAENSPSTLFLFGVAHFEGPQFFVYGGIEPLSFEKESKTSSNDTVSKSIYCVKLPNSFNDAREGGDRLQVPEFVDDEESESLRKKNTKLGRFKKHDWRPEEGDH